MRRHRSKEVGQLTWQTQALAALAEFDSAKAPSQRVAALRKLKSLFAGAGELKKVLRKCLALTKRAERLSTIPRRRRGECLFRGRVGVAQN
jgi:hypothetical protein